MIRLTRAAAWMTAGWLAFSSWAGALPPNVRALTSTPEDDDAPTVSRDGRWCVYVSDLDGNSELFRLELEGTRVVSSGAVAPSAARDIQPALSPDGEWLAWTSTREDAFGDVWVMRFPNGKPIQATRRGVRDANPRWVSRSGELWLQFESEDDDETIGVFEVPAGGWERERTRVTGESLEDRTGGLAAVYLDDTNGDGAIGAEYGDAPVACELDEEGEPVRQLSPPLAGLNSPVALGDGILFSANLSGNRNIYVTTAPFSVAALTGAEDALAAAKEAWRDRPGTPFEAVVLARQGWWLEPETESGRECFLFMLEVLGEAHRPEQAMSAISDAEASARFAASFSTMLNAHRAVLDVRSAVRAGDPAADVEALRRDAVVTLRAAFERQDLTPASWTWVGIELGEQLGALGRYEQAVSIAAEVENSMRVGESLALQARLARARLYAGFLPDEARRLLIEALRREGVPVESREGAALELAQTAMREGRNVDEKVIALRQLAASVPELTIVDAATRFREGELFADAGRWNEAEQAYAEAQPATAVAPRIAARAAFARAELQARQGRYEQAIDTYTSVSREISDRVFPEKPRFYEQAREGMIRRYLDKGEAELRLNDPCLALNTFMRLLDREPELVEAWRGRIGAEFQCGRLTAANRREYRRRARENGDEALAQYIHGLALTYNVPVPSDARKYLERAVELDSSVPYYHMALGFTYEQLGDQESDRSLTAKALEHYNTALGLLDPGERPRVFADLLINSGNVALKLGQYGRAADAYTRRVQQGVPFTYVETEFLMHRNRGIALFRASRPDEAVEAFEQARALLDELQDLRRPESESTANTAGSEAALSAPMRGMTEEEALEAETELMNREALALMEANRLEESAAMFDDVAARNPENSLNRVRALRTGAYALLRLSNRSEGLDRLRARQEAENRLTDALEILQSGNIEQADIEGRQRGGGLFAIDLAIAADGTSGARQQLGLEDEEYLVRAALSRLRFESKGPSEIADALESQLLSQRRLAEANPAYYQTAILITLDQLATQRARLGDHAGAAEALVEAIERARLQIEDVVTINAPGLAQALAHFAELALEADDPALGEAGLAETWLGQQASGMGLHGTLDASLREVLFMRDPDTGIYVSERAGDRGRLLLARAMLAERQAWQFSTSEGTAMDAVRAAGAAHRASELAQDVLDQANAETAGSDARRAAVLAHGLLIRLALRHGSADDAELARIRAASFARNNGYPDLVWWLEAQTMLSPDRERALAAAGRTIEALENRLPGLSIKGNIPPVELLARGEALQVADALEAGNLAGAVRAVERWRVARLRLALDDATPVRRDDRPADAEWLERALSLRDQYRRAFENWRETPPQMIKETTTQTAGEVERAWREHLAAGRSSNYPSALLLDSRPVSSEIADPAAAIADSVTLPAPAAFVLSAGENRLAWFDGEARRLETEDDWKTLAGNARIWFILGDALGDSVPRPRNLINMISFETTFLAMEELRLETNVDVYEWPQGEGELELPPAETAGILTPAWRLTRPIVPRGSDPYAWPLDPGAVPLAEILTRLAGADEATLDTSEIQHAHALPRALRAPLAAAALAQSGAGSARIDGEPWLGLLFTPGDAPDLAETELRGATGNASGFWRNGNYAAALAEARRMIVLSEALGKSPGEIANAHWFAAQCLDRLERFDDAAGRMRHAVDILRGLDQTETLAEAVGIHASLALSAHRFEEALESYQEAYRLHEDLGNTGRLIDMAGRIGVVYENSGQYNQALTQYEIARETAAVEGDRRAVVEQWRRIGRVHLRRLSDYPAAEFSFGRALEEANAANQIDLELLATLDLARVDEKLGRYEPAIRLTELVEERAQVNGLPVIEADAVLLRAFVQWVRADYFEAFKTVRRGTQLAEGLEVPEDRFVFQIIARNTTGLLWWSLNDTGEALDEFDEALSLSDKARLPEEAASTLNNRGIVRRAREEYDLALDNLNRALEIDTEQRNLWGQAYALRNIGMTYTQMGDLDSAIVPLRNAVQLSRDIGDRTNLAKSLAALGDALRETGQGDEARAVYEDALEEARALPLPEVEWRALYGEALVALDEGDTETTRSRLAEAIRVVERLRARIRIEEFQDGFLLDKQELYDDMVKLLLDKGEIEAALSFSERSRARNFIDLLGNERIELATPQDQETIERERSLRSRIEVLEKRLQSAGQDSRKTEFELQLEEARDDYQQFLTELRARNPQLSSFVEVQTIDIAELQAMLGADAGLLVYHVLPDEVAIWVIGPGQIDIVRTPMSAGELASRVQAYRERLQNFDDVDVEGDILSAALWQPVEPLTENMRFLGIVPHRELHLMPFAALRGGTGHMIDNHAIFMTPSASVLGYTIQRRNRRAGNTRVLAIGNPDLGNEALSLPFAEKEAERIPWTFPNAEVLTGERATESWLVDNIGSYGIVHLATHGEYDPHLPLRSAIQLTGDRQNDGRLTAREVFSLSLNADLVALSACQTGLGRLTNGDEIVGLNRSFVYAGTRQILSSLWRVDDVSTAVLIKHFYRNMEDYERAEALRLAQLEVRNRERYKHPAYWAGLFLSGDWE